MSGDELRLGRVAYDAFRFTWPHPAHRLWHELTESEREAWHRAADAAREVQRRLTCQHDEAAMATEVAPLGPWPQRPDGEQRRLTFKRDTAVTAIQVAPLGPKGVVPTLHAKAGDVLVCSPDGGEVYVQRGDVRAHEVVAHYVDDGRGVLRPSGGAVTS
jgi:hypothetical protein